MKNRWEIEQEMAKKKAFLANTAVVNKLPDKGKRIELHIKELEQQLTLLDQAPLETLLEAKLQISNPSSSQKQQNITKSSHYVPHLEELEWRTVDKNTDKYQKTEQIIIHGTKGVEYLKTVKQPRQTIFLEDEQTSIQLDSKYKETSTFSIPEQEQIEAEENDYIIERE